jgi:hypothetical protein
MPCAQRSATAIPTDASIGHGAAATARPLRLIPAALCGPLERRLLRLLAKTAGELTAALARATTHDGPCMIEVAIDPQDCSLDMREWGTRVAQWQAPRS